LALHLPSLTGLWNMVECMNSWMKLRSSFS
jgi:hypothetical protein